MSQSSGTKRSWRDRWLDLRDSWLTDTRFHHFARRFTPIRFIVRKRSRGLFDLVAGFTYSQILCACVRLGLFNILANGPLSGAEVARAIGWSEDHALRLLRAAAALELVQARSGGLYGLGIHGAALLGNPWIELFVEHHALLYADLADPVGLLGGDNSQTALRKYWGYAAADTETVPYTKLMAASQTAIAAEILPVYDFGKHRTLLDIGGGDGTFVAALAARHPNLDFLVFDLPSVAAQARLRLKARGLEHRVKVTGGRFPDDPLPHGADIATLVRVVHDHDDLVIVKLFAALRKILPEYGALVVAEPMAGIKGVEAAMEAYFACYFAALGSGRPRTPAEIFDLGRRAGFVRCRELRTIDPLLVNVVVLLCK